MNKNLKERKQRKPIGNLNSFLSPHKYPLNIYLFKVNNTKTRKMCKICSKLTIKTPEGRQYVNFYKYWAKFG